MAAKPKSKPKATRTGQVRPCLPSKKQLDLGLAPSSTPHELLLINEVTARARLSDTTLWRLEKAGRFPKRLKIGFKRVAWRAAEIDAWIAGTWIPPQAQAA